KNSPGHRHPKVHLANVIPSGVEKFRGVTQGSNSRDVSTSLDMTNLPLPVLIDMARCSAFIKLNPRLLVFHGFQKSLRLALAHLALLFGFGFGNLCVPVRRWLL